MSARAAIVVTGSELARGDRSDANGPFLARELTRLGVASVRRLVVGDDPAELEQTLREALAIADLVLTSGGLGPTHDDRTMELIARVLGRELVLDAELERRIESISRLYARRMNRPYPAFAAGVTKQATVPEGSHVLGLVGTAPAVAVEQDGQVVVALPGPPSELQRLWRDAVGSEPVLRVLERARPLERRVMRFFGLSESALADAVAQAGGEPEGVELTICAHDLELEAELFFEPGGRGAADALQQAMLASAGEYLFSRDDRLIEELVLQACRERGLTLATAESCTGGMVASRLTSVPGSSEVFRGGVVAYADAIKRSLLAVPAETLLGHGAVSEQTAAAMAEGARSALQADVAVSVTGIAGPGGGTEEKPVGLVYLCAATADHLLSRHFTLRDDRERVRRRTTVAALHLVRELLEQTRHTSA
ncbi:MAG: competence/damage-inducible protein A [Gaiellaceae bacterium]